MISSVLNRPKVIAVVADVNQGKSMLLYHLLAEASKSYAFNLYTYGLRVPIESSTQIFSVAEMEGIRDSVIIVDELSSLFDLDNRKTRRAIENTLRLINHNNNILILCGPPENFKKFLAAKVDEVFFKRSTIADFINGSTLKNVLTAYSGPERGSELLNLPVGESLYFDGTRYRKVSVPYYPQYDTKRDNAKILVSRDSIS